MTQQIIELGSGPDSNEGESLYSAFTKTNENFSQLFTLIGGGNNLTGNLVTANNFYTTGQLRVGNIKAFADIFTVGNVIGSGFYYPNGTPLLSSISSVLTAGVQAVTYNADDGNLVISTSSTDYTVDIGVGRTDDPVFNSITTGNIIPAADVTYDIGSSDRRWRDIWLSNSTIYLGEQQLSSDADSVFIPYGNLRTVGSGIFYGNMVSGANALYAGLAQFTILGSNVVAQFSANTPSYSQVNFQNINDGIDASTDYIATADNGTDSTYFVDLGITSSKHIGAADEFFADVGSANDGYLYVVGSGDYVGDANVGNLLLGSADGIIKMFVGNTSQANVVQTISTTGVTIGNVVINKAGSISVNGAAVSGVSNVLYDAVTGNLKLSTSDGTEFTVGPIASNITLSEIRNGIQDQIDNLVITDLQYAQIDAQVANAVANIAGVTDVTYDSISGNLAILAGGDEFVVTILGNASTLGDNTTGQLVSNAANLTSTTSVTDGLALLNEVLGKLVPSRPPYFPNNTDISINGLSSYRMTDFVQTDNTATGSKSVAGGTVVSLVKRSGAYLTSSVENVGPGETGVVSLLLNGAGSSSAALTGSSDGVYGSIAVYDNQDYHNVVDSVAAGFWSSFSTYASGIVSSGWNELYITHSQAAATNTITWYYDNSGPGAPIWSNTAIALISNVCSYSSTIPHLTSSSQFQLTANVSKLSGDTYPLTDTFVTGTAAGALSAPQSITYSAAGITTPLARNLYVSSGSAYITTTAAVRTGFGSSTSGPSLTAQNSYSTGVQNFAPGSTVLYKTGTSTQIEETSIPVNNVGIGSGNGARVINPGSTGTPAITSRSLFNSQNTTLETYDATVVAAVLKHDTTDYSTGFIPSGPDLSTGRSGDQYFTFKFTRTTVSKFDIKYTGTIAGMWIALPGSAIDTTSGLNGWLDMTTSYNGSGLPGVNGLGNGSNGCAVNGPVTVNTPVTNATKTATFGTESSSNSANYEIFVRIKLTSGQTVSAISIETATN